MKKVYFIDHYDSFSFNLMDWLSEALPSYDLVRVVFDDAESMSKLIDCNAPLIISPGPKHPKDVTQTLSVVRKKMGLVPIFGVCLGHQILAYLRGYKIVQSELTFHGSSRLVNFKSSDGVFSKLSGDYYFASYNSLCVSLPISSSEIVAVNRNNEVEALEISVGKYPAIGVQFHPESFLSENKKDLQEVWKSIVDGFYSDREQLL